MNCLVYKIQGDEGWYSTSSEMNAEEHDSPMFTNRSKAEKKIRDVLRDHRAKLKNWVDSASTFDLKPYWVERVRKWETARVVPFKLVRIEE